ncbi:MAG: hypothetical protein ACN4E6_14265 [Qipengyuania pacifica]
MLKRKHKSGLCLQPDNRLARRMRSDYPKPVTYIRALTLICFSFGLFVQVAAQAAVPQIEVAGTTDCAEMVQGMPNHPMPGQVIADKDKVDQHGPCREMTLDCLVAMNCLPPLALTAAGLAQTESLFVAPQYLSASASRLESQPLPPESPPPQPQLTI